MKIPTKCANTIKPSICANQKVLTIPTCENPQDSKCFTPTKMARMREGKVCRIFLNE